jgi:hypothetical protein
VSALGRPRAPLHVITRTRLGSIPRLGAFAPSGPAQLATIDLFVQIRSRETSPARSRFARPGIARRESCIARLAALARDPSEAVARPANPVEITWAGPSAARPGDRANPADQQFPRVARPQPRLARDPRRSLWSGAQITLFWFSLSVQFRWF